MKKSLIVIIVIILAFVGYRWGVGKFGEIMRAKMMPAMMTPKVGLSEVAQADVLPYIEAPGRVVSQNTVNVVAKIDGTLQGKHYKDGDFVKKGQLLFTIDPNKFIIAINKSKADLNSAKAQSKKADMDFARSKELLEKDYISKATYDDTQARKDVAAAQVAAAQAALADANRLYGYSRISAPVSGKIGAVNIVPGNYITPQSGPLATIMSTDPIYITYALDSKKYNELRGEAILSDAKGSAALKKEPIKLEVTLSNGTQYGEKGIVDFTDNNISMNTGTIELRATIKNQDNVLIPGDFVKVKIYSNTPKKSVIVPQSAVLQDPKGRYVYTIDDKNIAHQTRIEADEQFEKNWIVKSGLKAGDKIVTKGVVKVMDGKPVKILTAEEIKAFEDMGKSLDALDDPEEAKGEKGKGE